MLRWGVVALLVLPTALATIASADANHPPVVGPITADLRPPRTTYNVSATDADGDPLEYVWEWTGKCGAFQPAGPRAVWTHQHPPCGDEPFHPGTITVRVTDGRSPYVTRIYTDGSESGTGPVGDDPRDEPPPVITGEDLACDQNAAEGAFEPTQAVWQDDELFADAPGKQLSWDAARRHWSAELPMVKDKATLLFGVRGDRTTIHYNVTLAGARQADVKVRMQVVETPSLAVRTLYEWPEDRYLSLNAYGDCGAPRREPLSVPAANGVPTRAAFTLAQAGGYQFVMELADKAGRPIPHTQVFVDGRTLDVPELRLRLIGLDFAPPLVRPPGGNRSTLFVPGPPPPDTLDADLQRLAATTRSSLPDSWPLAPGRVHVDASRAPPGFIDFAAIDAQCRADAANWSADLVVGHLECLGALAQRVIFAQATMDAWTTGARGTVVALPKASYEQASTSREISGGEAHGPKFAIMRSEGTYWTLAHEVAHTMPWVWLTKGDCGREYHNNGSFGNGFQIQAAGTEHRLAKNGANGLMGAVAPPETQWIEQCSYWHLLHELEIAKDPPLQALAFRVQRLDLDPAHETVEILAGATMDGEPDLASGGSGAYAIVLKDATGAALSRSSFDVPAMDENGAPLKSILLAFRVPRPASAARLEIVGPHGTLAARDLSAAPTARIGPPTWANDAARPNGTLAFAFGAQGGAADTAYSFTLLASSDAGATWRALAPPTNATMALVDAANFAPGRNTVRVVASDGMQSASADVTFDLASRAPPAAGRGAPWPGALAALAALALAARARRAI